MKNRKTVQQVAKPPKTPAVRRYSSELDTDQEWDLQDDGTVLAEFQYQYEHDVDHRYFN